MTRNYAKLHFVQNLTTKLAIHKIVQDEIQSYALNTLHRGQQHKHFIKNKQINNISHRQKCYCSSSAASPTVLPTAE